MTHPPESRIEAYVRHPDGLSAAQRSAIAGHLAGCRACHEIGEYLRSFYLELEALQHKTSLQVEQWLQKHSALGRQVVLHPFRPQREVLHASDGYTVVLAALTHEPPALRFQTVATFTSAGQNVKPWTFGAKPPSPITSSSAAAIPTPTSEPSRGESKTRCARRSDDRFASKEPKRDGCSWISATSSATLCSSRKDSSMTSSPSGSPCPNDRNTRHSDARVRPRS